MLKKYKALVLMEHDLLREKVAGILSRISDIWMTMQLSESTNLIRACIQNKPEIVVLDLALALEEPHMISEIKENLPETIVVVFASDYSEAYDKAVKNKGADMLVDANIVESGISSMISKMAS